MGLYDKFGQANGATFGRIASSKTGPPFPLVSSTSRSTEEGSRAYGLLEQRTRNALLAVSTVPLVNAIYERASRMLREVRAPQPPPQDPPDRRRGRQHKSKDINLINSMECMSKSYRIPY